jgi:triphosphoribosyl-dephospho-CoA synthetase
MALATDASQLISLGIEAENAMLAATGGVNTHRGAIFCLGLALNAAMRCFPDNGHFSQSANSQQDMHFALCNIAGSILCNQLNVNDLTKTPLTGARAIAATGYRQLFEDWLPYYRDTLGLRPRYDNVIPSEASESHFKLLLRIMSTLDDTCVVHRVGKERAEIVKKETEALLKEMPDQVGHDGDSLIGGLCERYAAEGISPGGAADMLALTIFIHSILS